MDNIERTQEAFFKTLREIQEEVVGVALSKYNTKTDIEEFLNEVTYETIYGVMELIDGYTKEEIKLDLVDRKTKASIRAGIELHDTCVKYLVSE